MISTGLVVAASDGLHEDGWCSSHLRLSLVAGCGANALRIGVWVKPQEGDAAAAVFTVMCDRAAPKVQVVPLAQPTDIRIPMTVLEGDEISLRISTPHIARNEVDQRNLGFILSFLALE